MTIPFIGQMAGTYMPGDLPVGTIVGSKNGIYVVTLNMKREKIWVEVWVESTTNKHIKLARAARKKKQWVICDLPYSHILPIGQL